MDRCFWRIAHGYLRSMNDCENVRPFQYPRTAAIEHNIDMDLLIAARAFDGIAAAYATRDGACFLDNEGMDSLLATGVVNDVMDLHHDVFTGETRNCLRFMYPPDLKMSQAMESMSIVLTTTLCEIFRGHHRARLHNREDGRVSSASAPYSFSRARLRRVFKTLELYMDHYPQFWEW